MAKQEPQIETVTMTDGRVVDFPGKRRMLKESFVGTDGAVSVCIDFRNGETRTFTIPPALMAKCAAHGAEQKIGDETAGLEDIDDAVLAVDKLLERLAAGDWTQPREASGMAGTSILLKALVEATGKSVESMKAFLSGKTQAEKVAMRGTAKLAPIVQRLEAEKAARAKSKPGVDAGKLDEELAALGV